MSSHYKFEPITNPKHKFSWNFKLAKIWQHQLPKTPLGDKWKPNYCVLPEKHLRFMDEIRTMEVRPDDVWTVAFPKCGITWAQEMVWLICHNLDYDTAFNVKLKVRSPFLELSSLNTDEQDHKEVKAMLDVVNERTSPRHIKTHLPLAFLPEQLWTVKPKIVYVVRDPRDVAVSYYHQYKNLHGFEGSLSDFLDLFLDGLVAYTPFESHVMDFWRLRNEPNILYLTYEEMKSDLKAAIRKTAAFFDKELSDAEVGLLYDHLQPEQMRVNQAVNQEDLVNKSSTRFASVSPDYQFIRRASVGYYYKEMPGGYIVQFNRFVNEDLANCGFFGK